jgi:phosphate transport system substrate-binding protein
VVSVNSGASGFVCGFAVCVVLAVQPLQAQVSSISISGSSTVAPITELAIKEFRGTAAGRSATFTPVVVNGTGAGFRDFCSGKTAISNASRPINSKELKACAAAKIDFYELPIGFDAITVVVNSANTWAKGISLVELKRLWSRDAQGKVERWNQVNLDWPAKPINLYGPGKDSGTFEYFNKAINGESDNSRNDYNGSEDDNVIAKNIINDVNALGYFGFAYYKANQSKLRALAIDGSKGTVMPSLKNVQNETYQPLSRPIFIYVNNKQLKLNPSLRKFISYYLSNASALVSREGSIPLSNSQYRIVENKLFRDVVGSSFAGDLPVGISLGQLLNRSIDNHKKPEFRN